MRRRLYRRAWRSDPPLPAVRDRRGVALPVAPPRELVDERLRYVLDRGEAAGHVAVQRGVADGELALVAGREHERAELVGHRHEQVAADARLEVLLGDVVL